MTLQSDVSVSNVLRPDIPQYKNVAERITEKQSGVCRFQADSETYMQLE
jgi:hypothetical protein